MAVEIERKFLVRGDAWRAQVLRSVEMRQGYLSREPGRASVRVRLEDGRATLNIKAAVVGAARAEYEYAIDAGEAAEMLERLCGARVEKRRHYVPVAVDGGQPDDGRVWEIDEFLGANAGLIVAELELAEADQGVPCPEWRGREVTALLRYYNHSLSLRPFREWTSEERDATD